MCPPGVDQTERGPQIWNLLAPGLKKKLEMDSMDRSHVGPPWHDRFETCLMNQLFKKDEGWNAWRLLARAPRTAPQWQPSSKWVKRKDTSSSSRIEELPAEILAMMVSADCLSKKDIMALALSSTTLWVHILRHVERSTAKLLGPLAGTPISCVGNYLEDLPEPFKKDNLITKSIQHWLDQEGWMYNNEARNANSWCLATYEELPKETEDEAWMSAFCGLFRNSGIDEGCELILVQDLQYCASTIRGHQPKSHWVLRNLSKHEYVHLIPGWSWFSPDSEVAVSKSSSYSRSEFGFVHPSFVENLRLDDALLTHICWTKPKPTFGPYGTVHNALGDDSFSFLRGPWAGDAFDIVTFEDFVDDVARGTHTWIDVTRDVVKQTQQICQFLRS